ncbi:SIMPL domain-containing protein [Lacibacter sediminis]|uniref:SIMPL domain-containing protein n=1 Tax=Lacibacter sediminis TaxID=2760713 RepID=A0A7G5XKZ8_9BACT|nr:SIMPL domain-containing protein [Lacibacter sediminis]QNA46151.1 SIMPL domain-containing protein [Lacibacter sediminis]
MKQLYVFVVILLFTRTLVAQNLPTCNPYPKTITVTGTSEMEIVPNEIYVQVDLKEYKKKGEEKVELETIKQDFLRNCKSVGIPDSLITIASFEGANGDDWWRKKKTDPQLLSSISYQIKFSENSKMQLLAEKLNDEATVSFRVARVWHTQMTEFRKQLKVNAIKAAKEKCIYLTEAIGEKISHAITIIEKDQNNLVYPMQHRLNNSNSILSEDKVSGDGNGSGNVSFKKIKIEFSIDVVYALH